MGSSTDSRRAVVTSTSLSKYSPMTSSVSFSEPDCSPTPTISVSILGKDLTHALGNGAATLHLLLHLLHGQCEGVVADNVAGHIQSLGDRQTGRQHGGHAVGELCGGVEGMELVEGALVRLHAAMAFRP